MPVVAEPLTERAPATRPAARGERPLGTVVVTGGAAGLGAATADAVAAAGGTPVVVDLAPSGNGHESLVVDLADTAATDRAIRARAARAPGLDALVTCAGVDVPGRISDVPVEQWERVVRVNLLGTAAVVRAALPALIERRGRIVTVASTLAHRGVSDATAYCASKFGVVGFSRALTAELKGSVGVTMLTPGGMHTSFFDDREPRYKPGPDAQLCDPADVAAAVVFALTRPDGCEVKEIVVTGPTETSWP
jgi:NAD(P)-dependent dehydrogenase (short-subunit alcohol dehydrogenase family)